MDAYIQALFNLCLDTCAKAAVQACVPDLQAPATCRQLYQRCCRTILIILWVVAHGGVLPAATILKVYPLFAGCSVQGGFCNQLRIKCWFSCFNEHFHEGCTVSLSLHGLQRRACLCLLS